MIVTQKLEMNLDRPDSDLRLHAVQGDRNSRAVCFLLQENGLKWQIPGDFRLVVRYERKDGTGGLYEELEDDRPAWEARGNALTVYLAPQIMAVPGEVAVQLGMYSGDSVLHSFRFTVEVSGVLGETEEAGDFVRWRSAYFPQLTGAEPGQLVLIEEVDDQGRVLRARGVAPQMNFPETEPQPDEPGQGTVVVPAFPLQGKTVVCFGDDLFANCRDETSVASVLAEHTGAQVYNVGFAQSWLSAADRADRAPFSLWAIANAVCSGDFSWQDSVANQTDREQLAVLKEIDFSEVDAAILHFGTEDFRGCASVDEGDEDYSSCCGALRYSITRLLQTYPKLRLYVSLPLFFCQTVSGGTVSGSDTYQNDAGQKLTDYVEALRGTAAQYHVPVIDGYYGLGINLSNAAAFLQGGVYLSPEGRSRMGQFLGAHLAGCQASARSDGYSRMEMDAILGYYITEVAALVGGEA